MSESFLAAERLDDRSLHVWAGPLGLHLFWPDVWHTRLSWLAGWNVAKSLHIRHSINEEPIPVTLYVSPEILDDTISAEVVADLLRGDVAHAVEEHRKARKNDPRLH